jgi:glycosyltransferase involved in cell wall biosynthesis
MKLKIVTRMDWPSFRNLATTIRKAVRTQCTCTIHDWKRVKPRGNVLYVDTVQAQTLKFLSEFLPESNVVFYGTTEGHSLIDDGNLAIAKRIRIVAVSNFVRQMLEEVGVPVAGVLHHAIDMSDRKVDIKFYRKLKTKMRNRKVILTVSANHSRKGLDRLLQAYKAVEEKIQNVFLIVHSEPRGYYNLEKEARELKIKRLWLTNLFGRMTQPELNALYNLCMVYVQPSFSEGFGLPILEAFRFNKPAIAVNAPPFDEVIRQMENGILIPSDGIRWLNFENIIDFKMHTYRADDLAQAIIQTLSDQKLLSKMRLKIRQEKWNWDARKLYPELLDYFM